MGSNHQCPSGNNKEKKHHHDCERSSSSSEDCSEEAQSTKEAECPYGKENREEQISESKPKCESKTVTLAEGELEQLKSELAELKDKYLRVLAESENARKRLQKEKHELVQYALQNAIVDFLHPIDHMENALKFTDQMSGEVKNWAIGFQMILSQFKDVLTNNGVIPYPSVGKPFDPHLHEAIETIAAPDVQPGIVVEESLRGYKMGDRVIRPSRVKVAKAAAAPSQDKDSVALSKENNKTSNN